MDKDFDDQADMCEIIRALIASGKFEGTDDLNNLNVDFLDHIDCAGTEGKKKIKLSQLINSVFFFRTNRSLCSNSWVVFE